MDPQKNDLTEQEELKILGEIMEAYIDLSLIHILSALQAGDSFRDVVGPLGNPSDFVKEDIEELKKKKYLFVAGGVGTAPVYPQVKWLKEHGIDVDVIMGSKTKDLLILEEEMKAVAEMCIRDRWRGPRSPRPRRGLPQGLMPQWQYLQRPDGRGMGFLRGGSLRKVKGRV